MSIRELFLVGQSSQLMSTPIHSDEVESIMIAPSTPPSAPSVCCSRRTHCADRTTSNLAHAVAREMKCVLGIWIIDAVDEGSVCVRVWRLWGMRSAVFWQNTRKQEESLWTASFFFFFFTLIFNHYRCLRRCLEMSKTKNVVIEFSSASIDRLNESNSWKTDCRSRVTPASFDCFYSLLNLMINFVKKKSIGRCNERML